MSNGKKQFPQKTNVLLLWKRGEAGSLLENVDVTVLQDGVVQIRNPAKKETLTTHISNVVIISDVEF
ncbi:MAG: hypothetical protein JRD93_10410 [Deltaproteobacteria bacterium]|nr:hypothetical protein [Deltaproteobacteria bacterium]